MAHGRSPPSCLIGRAQRNAAPGIRRGRALPPHVHDPAAVVGGDAPARAGAVARRDELEPAPARVGHGAAGPRRVPVLVAAPAVHDLAGERDRRRPGVGGVRARRLRPDPGLGAARGARPPAPLVRQRPGHARRAARLHLGPRRRDPVARRLPARVEQAARAAARGRADRGPDARRRRRRVRRLGGGLVPGRGVLARRPRGVRRRGAHAQAAPADPDARRLAVRLRAASPAAGGRPSARGSPTRGCRTSRCTSSPRTPTR